MHTAFLVTNGNMGGTAGDTTLILRRARALYEKKEIFTKILLLNPVPQGDVNKGDYYYSIDTCPSKSQLKQMLLEQQPRLVILYGDKIQMMTASLRRFIKKRNLKTEIVIDIQGAVEEKKEYSNSFLRKHIVYPISRFFFKRAARNANAAFVVSDEIKDKCKKAGKGNSLKFYKIRCGFEELATADQIKSYRQNFRLAKGISEETLVFCYSGYRAKWQKVEEIIDHFKSYDAFSPNCFFAFFCNTDDEFEGLLKKSFPKGNFCVELLKPADYFKSLCGCDMGYILRDYNETNRVAFPNKFSDYLSSGLVVALNDALPEPTRLIKSLPTHYVNTDEAMANLPAVFEKLYNRAYNYDTFLENSLALGTKELLYSAQVQKLDF